MVTGPALSVVPGTILAKAVLTDFVALRETANINLADFSNQTEVTNFATAMTAVALHYPFKHGSEEESTIVQLFAEVRQISQDMSRFKMPVDLDLGLAVAKIISKVLKNLNPDGYDGAVKKALASGMAVFEHVALPISADSVKTDTASMADEDIPFGLGHFLSDEELLKQRDNRYVLDQLQRTGFGGGGPARAAISILIRKTSEGDKEAVDRLMSLSKNKKGAGNFTLEHVDVLADLTGEIFKAYEIGRILDSLLNHRPELFGE